MFTAYISDCVDWIEACIDCKLNTAANNTCGYHLLLLYIAFYWDQICWDKDVMQILIGLVTSDGGDDDGVIVHSMTC